MLRSPPPIGPFVLVLASIACPTPGSAAQSQSCTLELASGGNGTTPPNGYANNGTLSADGRWLAYSSTSSNLVAGDTNATADVFLVDRANGTTQRIGLGANGVEGNGYAWGPQLTPDARLLVFASEASNLVAGDANGGPDVFVHDLATGQEICVSVTPAGAPGNGGSGQHVISADGRFVAFESGASDLVANDTNGKRDVFVRDLQAGTTERVSVDTAGSQGNGDAVTDRPPISADGRYVAFASYASNLVPLDSNGRADVFLRDRVLGSTTRVSVSTAGLQGNGHSVHAMLSANGRHVGFQSLSTNLVPGGNLGQYQTYVRDLATSTTARVSLTASGNPNGQDSMYPSMSADGRYVTFVSSSGGVVPGDQNGFPDVFLRDRQRATTERISVTAAGGEVHGVFIGSELGRTGALVAFDGDASDLAPVDLNAAFDVFVRDCSALWVYCLAPANSQGCVPVLATAGAPSASSGSGFTIGVSNVLNGTFGTIAYTRGPASTSPFGDGLSCVGPTPRVLPRIATGGSPSGVDCTGTVAIDFNAWIASGADPALVLGERVRAMFVTRDPYATLDRVAYSEAVEFTIGP